MIFLSKKIYILYLVSLSGLISSYTNASENKCQSDNINQNLNCFLKNNDFLENELINKGNNREKDVKKWEKEISNKCEGYLNYGLGEGPALARESCYNQEYKSRLGNLSHSKKNIERPKNLKNNDGFYITPLPYNSNNHINCILLEEKNSCSQINLINSTNLIKVYNFINPSYGDSVIFPETNNGVLLIASPSISENESPEINLMTVNKFGLVKSITLDVSKNILINQNYEVFYKESGQNHKLRLNEEGRFVK
ncbi:hypothetical protein NVT87_13935 [Acinetobacter radioresistens]|jgi:hypothetical protein|uniref:Uncharacterized protein n=2 Tax=Acinetobacter radioresistens TaxID=40216 RepID=A0ABP2GIJ1_ACIRA|nr:MULTISPECIES: hypothetical protein [Acinetobacter]EET81473.1 hypothetical protein ACIRA0001_0503 [Acinetobacter radioresistens SK82]EEY85613.1 hypothetical protein HMPREF0018_02689 [Acinetobacter radioresistens SH164]ENV86220.1 hypothetical protein F940_01532 [Acinetobacter radioresistens NIPH 2130]EXE56239.1 hypothetical protein J579_2717 [Acinetobacter sp. 1239920]MCK4079080.1 hypothetical protein [Acinetobacter radioresistens]